MPGNGDRAVNKTARSPCTRLLQDTWFSLDLATETFRGSRRWACHSKVPARAGLSRIVMLMIFQISRNQGHPHTWKLKGGHFGLAPEKSITLSVGESDVCKFRKDRPRTGPGTQQGRLYFVHQLTPVIINLGQWSVDVEWVGWRKEGRRGEREGGRWVGKGERSIQLHNYIQSP